MFLKLYIFGKIPPIKLELTICTKSWKGVQLLKRIHYSLVVNGCCCWVSVALLTREIQFSNFPQDSWRTFNFFLLSYLSFSTGGEAARIQFRPVKLLSLREEASVNRFEGDQYRDWFQHVDSFLFLLVRRWILPFMGHFVRKNWGQRFARSNCFRTVSNWGTNFFPPLLAQFNFHIIDCTRCKYIYTFFDLIIFYGEKPFCEEYNRYNKMFIFCNLFLLSIKFPLRKFSIYIYIYYNR